MFDFLKDKRTEQVTKQLLSYKERINVLKMEVERLGGLLESSKQKIEELRDPNTVRKQLGLMPLIDFTNNEEQKGTGILMPRSFIPADTESQEYKSRVSELAMIWRNDTFRKLIKYLIDFQGNYTLRYGDTHEKTINGRYFIEGIEMVEKLIKDAYTKSNAINAEEQEDKEPDGNDIELVSQEIVSELLDN
jgi:hypothetical protein